MDIDREWRNFVMAASGIVIALMHVRPFAATIELREVIDALVFFLIVLIPSSYYIMREIKKSEECICK